MLLRMMRIPLGSWDLDGYMMVRRDILPPMVMRMPLCSLDVDSNTLGQPDLVPWTAMRCYSADCVGMLGFVWARPAILAR